MEQRIHILNLIFKHFQQVTQWLPSHIENSNEYMRKAEGLIEYLEVIDCGSIGGYDKENKIERVTQFALFDRFLALIKKYENYEDIQECCGFDIPKMIEYYKTLSKLREKVLNGVTL